MSKTQNITKVSIFSGVLAGLLALAVGVSPSTASEKVLYNFEGAKESLEWRAVNDNVMGGVSKGGATFPGNGTMQFAGTLSLANRGGFSSIRTGGKRVDLSDYDGLTARVRGDGRTYWMTVNTNVRIPAGSYRVVVRTEPGKWQVIRAPFSTFRATSFGRALPVFIPLNRAKVESIGFLIADKKAGPFQLEVDWINAEKKAETKVSVDGPAGPAGGKGKAQPKDIVDTAVGAGAFKTLVAAAKAAGLAETLKGKGPFTVFAPTDEAFAKLPKGTVQSLLKPENKDKLTSILTYHVAAGRLVAADVVKLSKAPTLNGRQATVRVKGKGVRLDNANVVKTDIFCSNGVIHVIDAVLIPPEDDIIDVAVKAGKFNTLAAALKAAGLVETLKGKGPFTVFAPTDEAFAKLPKGTVESLLRPENKDKLTAILTYHVAAGRTELGRQSFKSLQGSPLNVASGDYLVVNGVKVLTPNIAASNGVIHVIDGVLLPKLPEPTPADLAKKLIELAVSRGAPLFNRGQRESCAAIYEVTVLALLNMEGAVLADSERETLRKALDKVVDSDDARAKSWTLRRALDSAYHSLNTD